MYYKTKMFRFFRTYFMHNIVAVSNSRWHDSLSMRYIEKESSHQLSEIPPTLFIKLIVH